jgi:predicted nucleic acid-binding protein
LDIFFDTSVLVASCVETHSHFAQADAAVERVLAGRDKGFLCAHSIAEMFFALTRLPLQPRIPPIEAARLIMSTILPHFQIIPLAQQDYLDAMEMMVNGGWSGAKIYDVLLLRGAEKSGAERIYTFNLADFRQLAPAQLRSRVCSP